MTHFVPFRRTAMLGAALALGALVGASDAGAGARRFGALSLTNVDGDKVSIAELRGKVVVLNFWATWCKPCITEMPQLASIAERYNERGLRVVAASVDEEESRDAVEQFARLVPKGMEVWVGATLADMQRLEVGQALPVTVLLDRQGNVVQVHRGGFEKGDFDETLEKLLGGAAPIPEKKKLPGVTEAFAPPSMLDLRCWTRGAGLANRRESGELPGEDHRDDHCDDHGDAETSSQSLRS